MFNTAVLIYEHYARRSPPKRDMVMLSFFLVFTIVMTGFMIDLAVELQEDYGTWLKDSEDFWCQSCAWGKDHRESEPYPLLIGCRDVRVGTSFSDKVPLRNLYDPQAFKKSPLSSMFNGYVGAAIVITILEFLILLSSICFYYAMKSTYIIYFLFVCITILQFTMFLEIVKVKADENFGVEYNSQKAPFCMTLGASYSQIKAHVYDEIVFWLISFVIAICSCWELNNTLEKIIYGICFITLITLGSFILLSFDNFFIIIIMIVIVFQFGWAVVRKYRPPDKAVDYSEFE